MFVHEKGSTALIICIAMIVGIFVLSTGIFLVTHKGIFVSSTNSMEKQSDIPQMKITDLAPSVSYFQKSAVVVEHSDSSFEKFLLPTTSVNTFIAALPKGDKFISKEALR